MKNFIFAFVGTIILASNANATIHTVSNNVNSPGQYTDLQAAITAAVNNDTIYIHRSDVDYGSITINKTKLTRIKEVIKVYEK